MTDEELTREIAGMLVRIEINYQRETSGPGSRFEGRTLESVQAEAVVRRVREHLYEQVGNEHYVIFTDDGWSTEHSIECRLSGHMHECAHHETIREMVGKYGPYVNGRWKIARITAGLPVLERAETQP